MFLTDEELHTLTGYVRNADRCRWLDRHHWIYVRSVTGRPNVSRSYAESKLSEPSAMVKREPKLNLAVIRG